GARGRRCSVSRLARRRAVPPRFLPGVAAAGMPASGEAALGPRAAPERRAAAPRTGRGPRVRAVAARGARERPQRDAGPAAGAVVRPLRPQRAAADPHHRVRAGARAPRRRPDARPLPRPVPHRLLALFYRAWAQAQPHVNRDRPDDDHFAIYVGAFAGLAPATFRERDTLPDPAKFFHVGALGRQVRNGEG